MAGKRAAFTPDYAARPQRTQIECRDALRIIKNGDAQDAFFYGGPPYVGADQGHYDGYTQEDFDSLLNTLEAVDGRFLLSSYPNESLRDFTERDGRHTFELKMASTMTNGSTNQKKVEVLTATIRLSLRGNEFIKAGLAARPAPLLLPFEGWLKGWFKAV
jgi:DNA adenine methylase